MSAYLSNAACKGYPPKHLAALRHYPRPDLTARLLRDRKVARFIVAPAGFGKSALALEYSSTVFSHEHVFWLDGTSPCFLRDLDRDVIAESLLAVDRDRFLVVFEDVPLLDANRSELLSRAFDRLLARGCEVVATCTPTCDVFAKLQQDRLRMAATDMLLGDAEIDAVRTADETTALPAGSLPASQRVAGLRWAPPGGARAFIAAAMKEEMPADVLLTVAVALVLQEGALSDLAVFGPCNEATLAHLAENYPYLGIDVRAERFETVPFAVSDLAAVLHERLTRLAACSRFDDGDGLVLRLSDALAARSSSRRACELMSALASRPARASWLAARTGTLFEASCLVPARELHASLGDGAGHASGLLLAAEAARLQALGDGEAASAAARRVLASMTDDEQARAMAALVLFCGTDDDRAAAARQLGAIVSERGDDDAFLEIAARAASCEDRPWVALSVMALAHLRCAVLAWSVWEVCRRAGTDRTVLLIGASWALERAARDGDAAGEAAVRLLEAAASFVGEACAEGPCGLFEAVAGLALERAGEHGAVRAPMLDTRTSLAVHRVEMGLLVQREAHLRQRRDRPQPSARRCSTRGDVMAAGNDRATAGGSIEPTLTVNLFGGLEVRIGDEEVDPHLFRRQKVKTLLALLVLNRGREFSRDVLVQLLWPDSSIDAARKNFYGIWSMLRRALTTPAGTCPYLIRQQNGLRLDGRFLVSDVAQMESVCRTLQLERSGYGGWAALLTQINERFSDDLLPSEDENEHIVQRRLDYRNRFVDALVAASRRLVVAGDVHEGLWFARAALSRDRTREDAYTTLMSAQLAAGQRTAALETYFSCRRYLADELGIDPSLETMGLYRAIIETEEALV